MDALGDDDGSVAWRHERVTVQVECVWVHYWLAQVDEMTNLVERARGDVEAHGSAGLRARFYQAIVHQELRRGRYRIAPETVALARSSPAPRRDVEDLSQKANARFVLGCVLAFAGDPDDGAAALTAARADAQRVGDVTLELRALTYLTVARRMCDDVEAVTALSSAARRLARRLAMPDYVGVAQANEGWARWRLRRRRGGARRARRRPRDVGLHRGALPVPDAMDREAPAHRARRRRGPPRRALGALRRAPRPRADPAARRGDARRRRRTRCADARERAGRR